jgi:hypothetical protein
MTTTETILSRLEANLVAAKTKGMRDFVQEQIDGYKARLAAKQKPKPEPPKAFTAFLESSPACDCGSEREAYFSRIIPMAYVCPDCGKER